MIDNLKRVGVNFLKKRYSTVLSKIQGRMFSTDFEMLFARSPHKIEFYRGVLFTSYSDNACLQAPQGGMGLVVGLMVDPATIAMRSIF